MIDLTKITDEELQQREKDIISRCSGWSNSQDGSYGLALHSAGLTDVTNEQVRRKEAKND